MPEKSSAYTVNASVILGMTNWKWSSCVRTVCIDHGWPYADAQVPDPKEASLAHREPVPTSVRRGA